LFVEFDRLVNTLFACIEGMLIVSFVAGPFIFSDFSGFGYAVFGISGC